MEYPGWKLIHIVAVILFLGNITTGLFWAAHAHKSRQPELIGSTFAGIIRSDRWFTMPGVIGLLVGGVGAAMSASIPILATGWILWPIVLFSISGIVFAARVAPLQGKILRLSAACGESPGAWQAYADAYRAWELWGLLALATPAASVVIMVLKPPLPGL